MPVSPVCLDTLVLATVGAAENLSGKNTLDRCLSENGTVRLALAAMLTVLICRDIEDPLLLSGKSNKILMRELFPQSKQKASAFENRFQSVAK